MSAVPNAKKRKAEVSVDAKEIAVPDIADKFTVPEIAETKLDQYFAAVGRSLSAIGRALNAGQPIPGAANADLTLFMNYLDSRSWTASSIPANAKVRLFSKLNRIFTEDSFRNGVPTPYTAEIKARAEALHERWTKVDIIDDDELDDDVEIEDDEDDTMTNSPRNGKSQRLPSGSAASTKKTPSGAGPVKKSPRVIINPGPRDPIFGDNGPMRGISYSVNQNGRYKNYVLNRHYAEERVKTNIFGHNGLTVGDWFPFQIVALFKGAHGAKMGGISGIANEGACSIVVSGLYADLDEDKGNVLYYSGSGSHDNRDPATPKRTAATELLKTSRTTRRPVRVLRSSSSGGQAHYWCPAGGLRYDGLYIVVDCITAKNRVGGAYEKFKLVREEGQGVIDRLVPSQAQLEVLARIKAAK